MPIPPLGPKPHLPPATESVAPATPPADAPAAVPSTILKPEEETQTTAAAPPAATVPADEEGGPKGAEPTRFGDWERKGRCIDF